MKYLLSTFGLMVLFTGFGFLILGSLIGGVLLLLSGILLIPYFNKKIIEGQDEKKNKVTSNQLYVSGVVIFFIGILLVDVPEDSQTTTETEATSKNDKDDKDRKKVLEIADSIKSHNQQVLEYKIENFDSIAKANSLRKSTDDFKPDAVFYHPKGAPLYRNVNWVYPYLSRSGDNFALRYVMQYEAEDWLFIDNVKARIENQNGDVKIVDLVNGQFERDNKQRIWEWADVSVSDLLYMHLLDMVNAKSVKIRYEGRQYHSERTLTRNEINALKSIINTYKEIRN